VNSVNTANTAIARPSDEEIARAIKAKRVKGGWLIEGRQAKTLWHYLKVRADFEGVKLGLSPAYLQAWFNRGTRWFFGVLLDDSGKLLSDEQQPTFFQHYLKAVAGMNPVSFRA